MDIPENFYRVTIKALIKNENSELLLSRDNTDTWDFLGGGLDYGETPLQCLTREFMEETGLKIKKFQPEPVFFITAGDNIWRAGIFYNVEVVDLNFIESSECVEIRFFNKAEASKLKMYPIPKKFFEM